MKKIWHRIPGKTDREKVPIQKESLEKGDLVVWNPDIADKA